MENRDRARERVAQQVLPGILSALERDLGRRIVLHRIAPGGTHATPEIDGKKETFFVGEESWDDYPASDATERAQLEIIIRERLKVAILGFLWPTER